MDMLQMYMDDDTFERLFNSVIQKRAREMQDTKCVDRQQYRFNSTSLNLMMKKYSPTTAGLFFFCMFNRKYMQLDLKL